MCLGPKVTEPFSLFHQQSTLKHKQLSNEEYFDANSSDCFVVKMLVVGKIYSRAHHKYWLVFPCAE